VTPAPKDSESALARQASRAKRNTEQAEAARQRSDPRRGSGAELGSLKRFEREAPLIEERHDQATGNQENAGPQRDDPRRSARGWWRRGCEKRKFTHFDVGRQPPRANEPRRARRRHTAAIAVTRLGILGPLTGELRRIRRGKAERVLERWLEISGRRWRPGRGSLGGDFEVRNVQVRLGRDLRTQSYEELVTEAGYARPERSRFYAGSC
jgi:hypothetical protein